MKKIISLVFTVLIVCVTFMFGMQPVLAVAGEDALEIEEPDYYPSSGQCGEEAWFEYSEEKLVIRGSGKIDDMSFARWREIEHISIEGEITSIGKCAFWECANLRDVTISDSVEIIKESAFEKCTNLESLNGLQRVKTIEEEAFSSCDALESINLVNVETIGMQAFAFCEELKSVTIPDSLVKVGNMAFMECSKLDKVIFPNGNTQMGYLAFFNCSDNLTIISPKGGDVERFAIDNNIKFLDINEVSATGSVISEGSVYIIVAAVVVAACVIIAITIAKKKHALASSTEDAEE